MQNMILKNVNKNTAEFKDTNPSVNTWHESGNIEEMQELNKL